MTALLARRRGAVGTESWTPPPTPVAPYVHDPALYAGQYTAGQALSNGATTHPDAGWVLSTSYSGDGVIRAGAGHWQHEGTLGVARFNGNLTNPSPQLSIECKFVAVALPSAPIRLLEFRTTTAAGRLEVLTSGALQVTNAAAVHLHTTSATVTAGAPFRVHMGVNPTTGAWDFHLYLADNGDSTTAADEDSGTGTDMDTGNITSVRFGRIQSDAATGTIRTLYMLADPSKTGPIGPLL